jgi:hypothetical protein
LDLFLDAESKLNYVKYLEKLLGISSFDDWKNISTELKNVNLPPNWR